MKFVNRRSGPKCVLCELCAYASRHATQHVTRHVTRHQAPGTLRGTYHVTRHVTRHVTALKVSKYDIHVSMRCLYEKLLVGLDELVHVAELVHHDAWLHHNAQVLDVRDPAIPEPVVRQ